MCMCVYISRAVFQWPGFSQKVSYACLANGMEPGVVHDTNVIGQNVVLLVVQDPMTKLDTEDWSVSVASSLVCKPNI